MEIKISDRLSKIAREIANFTQLAAIPEDAIGELFHSLMYLEDAMEIIAENGL